MRKQKRSRFPQGKGCVEEEREMVTGSGRRVCVCVCVFVCVFTVVGREKKNTFGYPVAGARLNERFFYSLLQSPLKRRMMYMLCKNINFST